MSCIYETLHSAIREFSKLEKYSLGIAIEKLLLRCIGSCFLATTAPRGALKIQAVATASAQFDTLKVYIRLALKNHSLDEAQYLKLLPGLGTIGTMLGGWLKDVQKPNPNPKTNLEPPQPQSNS